MKRHFPSSLDSRVSCYFVYLGTKLKDNNQIGTIAKWGPTFRVAVDIIVHSNSMRTEYPGWSNIIRFISLPQPKIYVMGDRIPAIFYYAGDGKGLKGAEKGYLHITNAVNNSANYAVNYLIDLRKWYHIELAQTKINGTVCEIYNS